LAGCRGGGGHLSFVVLVSEKPNLVSEKSGKSQGILFICGAGNPVRVASGLEKSGKFDIFSRSGNCQGNLKIGQ